MDHNKIVLSYRDLSLSIHHTQQLKYSMVNDGAVRKTLQNIEDFLIKLRDRYDEYTITHYGDTTQSPLDDFKETNKK